MSKLLITGASGFVGQNLLRYLQGSIETVTLSLRDNFDESRLESISTIVHLAGKAHDLKNVSAPEEYFHVNYELTKKLYDLFLKSQAQKFIFISSVKAMVDQPVGILTEDQPAQPVTAYGKSKLMAEEYIRSQQLPEGKSFYILRPCMIHGPGNKGNLNLLYKFVSKGIPWPFGAFENSRSFLSVENLCFVIRELATRNNVPGGAYLVADDEPLSTNALIKTIASGLNTSPRILKIPRKLIQALAATGDALHLPLNKERLQKITGNFVVSNKKLVHALGTSLPVTATDGIALTIQSFKTGQ
jgi:nucleoside-diphosphate-sugar epimerase